MSGHETASVPEARRVEIFDTTLRDGEQSPGISLNTQEKVEIAQQLARLGVDVIEAGFPITSPGDFEAVEAIARGVEGPAVCGLARTYKADIDAAWNAIKNAERSRIHTFISTSDIHIEHQLQTTREDVKGQAKAAVAMARSYCDDVEFSPMDATRADVGFTAEECAVNGIGERAGNCSLEEIVVLLRTRGEVHGLDTGVDARELARTSRMVTRFTGYQVPPNKAVVGRNAFAHESGIHQDGVLKERTTFEWIPAAEVGAEAEQIVLGKHSGRHALRDALEQLGFKVSGEALNQAFKRFKEIADKKKQLTALDLEAIVSDEMRERTQGYNLAWFDVEASSRREPHAKVAVLLPNGEESVAQASGDGPVDAIFGAIREAVDTECELRQ